MYTLSIKVPHFLSSCQGEKVVSLLFASSNGDVTALRRYVSNIILILHGIPLYYKIK